MWITVNNKIATKVKVLNSVSLVKNRTVRKKLVRRNWFSALIWQWKDNGSSSSYINKGKYLSAQQSQKSYETISKQFMTIMLYWEDCSHVIFHKSGCSRKVRPEKTQRLIFILNVNMLDSKTGKQKAFQSKKTKNLNISGKL